jgi:cbb3-type cytochrome oxidase maturation protein
MDIVYLLIPISLVLIGLIIWGFLWAIKSGQFDDLEGPAHEILMDNDDLSPTKIGDKSNLNRS